MGRRENLSIHSDPVELRQVRSAIEAGGTRVGFNKKDCHAMALAVDEALANVIKHAYGGAADKKIEIEIEELNEEVKEQGLKVSIRDFGKAVEISKIKGRKLTDIRPGGLGVHIMRKVMDKVVFECPPSGGTLLRMVKYRRNEQKRKETTD
ncbi:MAG: ATP-binding protein [Phycisphaerae bacterium]|nr:ATP-binding protein [Phycisphaerae bacterium]